MSSLTTSADVIDLTAHFITGEYLDGRQVADLTIIGKAVKDGGVSANETTYGTAEEKRAAWENWQRAVDRLYKEDDSRTLKELCYLASKEVVGANGKAVKPDTIRHHIRNPASRRKFR